MLKANAMPNVAALSVLNCEVNFRVNFKVDFESILSSNVKSGWLGRLLFTHETSFHLCLFFPL